MSEPKDNYTIMIFRGSMAGPLRFSFSRKLVKSLMGLGIALVLVELILLSQVVLRIGEMWELKALRAEVQSAREQTTMFSTAVDDLKRRLMTMKEVNQRLRVMLGIDAQTGDGDLLNGRGGEEASPQEAPIAEPTASGPVPAAPSLPPAMGMSEMPDADSGKSRDGAAVKVQQDLAFLQSIAGSEERTLEQLTQAAQGRQARWAATPSVWPVKGWVTSGFGQRVSPFTGQMAMHDGLDIGAPPNSPVQAPAAGRVVAQGFDPRMGNVVAVDHGFGIETQYGHLAKILVKSGQSIKRGDVLGLVGSTGLSTGPHLHYLLKVNGRAINPSRYILD
jgi:murein DD-endopeptidase MepM/ murein hydrolase activator NlpD